MASRTTPSGAGSPVGPATADAAGAAGVNGSPVAAPSVARSQRAVPSVPGPATTTVPAVSGKLPSAE